MSDDTRALTVGRTVQPATVRRIVSVILATLGLLILLGLAATLPGIDRLVAGLHITPLALLTAIATLMIVIALIWVTPAVERAVLEALDGPAGAVTNAAAGAKLLVGFVAVGIAYRGFAPALTPLFEAFGLLGVYHLVFLVIGLAVLGAFARRLYRCWEPVTTLLTAHAVAVLGTERRDISTTE